MIKDVHYADLTTTATRTVNALMLARVCFTVEPRPGDVYRISCGNRLALLAAGVNSELILKGRVVG